MAGWTCADAHTIVWDGRVCAESFCGDGSALTGITGTGGIANLDGGDADEDFGGVAISPIDGGDST